MKLLQMIAAGGLAAVAMVAPAAAQHTTRTTTTTTVTRVHGPLRVLPHHSRKVCRTRWVNHHRVRKCSYR